MRRVLVVAGGVLIVTVAMRLLAVAGGQGLFAPPALVFPDDYTITRFAGNPVIDVADNPAGGIEQYVPAPILLPNGDIWVYVKGSGLTGNTIFAWRSVDDGETFTLENSDDPVLDTVAATWESNYVLEPSAIYDDGTDTIHLYYKARAGANTWAWGHATADGSDPTDFTKDAGNPILTSDDVEATLGGSVGDDLAIHSVLKVGSTVHFFGYTLHDAEYKLLHASGSDWDDVGSVEVIFEAGGTGLSTVSSPNVFRSVSDQWTMLYSIGDFAGADSARIRVATSADLETWDFSDTADFLAPVAATWESRWTYACSILKDGLSVYPYEDGSGRWLLYFSGYNGSTANSGLAYIEPS